MTPKLDVNGVSFSYHTLEGETLALSDISFSLSPGEFAAVVGPSGCGKSTLLSLLCGLSKPDTGQILLDGHPLRQSPSDTGYMLQRIIFSVEGYFIQCISGTGNPEPPYPKDNCPLKGNALSLRP